MMQLNGNIWLEDENGFMIGKGKAQLLAEIDKTGSISEAAQHLNLSYRKAWGMVQQLNTTHGSDLVTKRAGGKKGGYAQLTAIGRQRMQQFYTAQQQFDNFVKANPLQHNGDE
jgi:molybdate transport system regulatory protein